MSADLVDFEFEVVGGLSDGVSGLEEGLGDLSAGRGPVGLVGDDEDEEGVGETGEGELDAPADLSGVEISEACDLCCGMAVAVHGFDEGAIGAFEVDGAADDLVCKEGVAAMTEVDPGGELVEPIGLVDFAGHLFTPFWGIYT